MNAALVFCVWVLVGIVVADMSVRNNGQPKRLFDWCFLTAAWPIILAIAAWGLIQKWRRG